MGFPEVGLPTQWAVHVVDVVGGDDADEEALRRSGGSSGHWRRNEKETVRCEREVSDVVGVPWRFVDVVDALADRRWGCHGRWGY